MKTYHYILIGLAFFIGLGGGYLLFHKATVKPNGSELISAQKEILRLTELIQKSQTTDSVAGEKVKKDDSILTDNRKKYRDIPNMRMDCTRYMRNIEKINQWGKNRY